MDKGTSKTPSADVKGTPSPEGKGGKPGTNAGNPQPIPGAVPGGAGGKGEK